MEDVFWSLARTSLKVKVKGQDDQGQKGFFGPFSLKFASFAYAAYFFY